jgi:hypothetical protein
MAMSNTTLSDRLLEIAGLAAEALERKGFVSVARKREGIVSIEWWKVIGPRQYHMRREVTDADVTPEMLAQSCAAEFQTAMSSHGSS